MSASVPVLTSISVQVRTDFTYHFLRGAFLLARRSSTIEETSLSEPIGSDVTAEHTACVVGAILQAVAAMEADISEVTAYGPTHHLGSNQMDQKSKALLSPIADVIDRQPILRRFTIVLHLLGKHPINAGSTEWQNVDLLIRLRNEIVHYKSLWNDEMSRKKFIKQLQSLKHNRPPFVDPLTTYFPHHCLNADCAAWAANSALRFLDLFYSHLEVKPFWDPLRDSLKV